MPPSLVTDPAMIVTDFPRQSVALIDYLGAPEDWLVQPHLYCDRLTLAVNAIDEAVLSYEIGAGVVQPGAASFGDYQPLAAQGKFVRITINSSPLIEWVGYVLSQEVLREGVKSVGGVNKLVGQQQRLHCVGLEWFLDRKQIDSAIVEVGPDTLDYVRIHRPLVFNGGPIGTIDPTSSTRANRSTQINVDGQYVFSDEFQTADLWDGDDIVAHLLTYHTPRNAAGDPAPAPFRLHTGDSAAGFLDGFFPTLTSENKTVFALLNEICRPQRGLVWWTEYSEAPDPAIDIRVQSLAAAAVSLPSGGTLPGNTNQETLDFDGELDVRSVQLKQLGMRDYDQVVCRGARQTSTFTVGVTDQTLTIDWSQDGAPSAVGSEPKYKAGTKDQAGYADLSATKKAEANDAFRLSNAFDRVFTAYRIPVNWNGKSGDGATSPRNWALPVLSPNGSVTDGLPIHVQGLRLLNTLRLKRGWNYANPVNPQPNTPDDTLADLAPPFAFVQVKQNPNRWQFVDKLDESEFGEGRPLTEEDEEQSEEEPAARPRITTTFHLAMQPGVPGIRLIAHNGMPHALALNHWQSAEPTQHEPEVDYATLRATVCCEADQFCEGIWPESGLPANKPLNVLVIDFGEAYRLDFLPAHTVVELANGGPITSGPTGAVLRDDRKYLSDMARLAYTWYELGRQQLSVVFRQVRPLFELGMLITAIGEGSTQENVNTVVSSITYDMLDGTVRVDTEDDTLDVRALA